MLAMNPLGNKRPALAALEVLRHEVLQVLADCRGPACERVRDQIDGAASAEDLWLLRCEVYQLVARQHCQGLAVSRVNGLLPAFEPWLPARQLARV
jgi:hypothetical protein